MYKLSDYSNDVQVISAKWLFDELQVLRSLGTISDRTKRYWKNLAGVPNETGVRLRKITPNQAARIVFLALWDEMIKPEIRSTLKAKDFENDRTTKSSGWWDWRPSKVALERLHFSGQLLATRKKDFHKLYDLTDNVVPAAIDRTQPTPEALARHLIFRSLKALGIAYANEIAWSGRLVKPPVKEELKRLVNEGDVCLVHVDGLKGPLYMLKKYANKKITLAGDVFILSPFDILNVFRRRLKDFFDFDYQVECFVPEPKRKFGYFSLPILVGDAFVARMDAKANRKEGVLTIHNLHFENVTLTQALTDKLVEAINAFAKFNTCTGIRITKCNNKGFMRLVNGIK